MSDNARGSLSKSQSEWLEHIRACEAAGQTMVEYARARGLKLKSFYNARRWLIKCGVLSPRPTAPVFRRVQVVPAVDALKAIVVQQAAEIERLSVENQRQQAHLGVLEEQLNILLAKRFGASSENQLRLFNEAERDGEGVDVERQPALITIPTHQRLKPGRKPLPASLPRIEVVHELAEAERVCTHDGHRLIEIGEELSEQLDIIPAQV